MTPSSLSTAAPDFNLHACGLQVMGSWHPGEDDALPWLPGRRPVAQVWLVGVAGSHFWPHFKASPFFADGLPDPLDRWSRAIAEPLAARYNGRALFPFEGPPYYPFQRWAERVGATHNSPLRLHIHPVYGLWHAYRIALALPDLSTLPDTPAAPGGQGRAAGQPPASAAAATDICARCDAQPCLHACPAHAFNGQDFIAQDCSTHLQSASGQACVQNGCRARHACPVGHDYRYLPEHAAFHMRAFMAPH